MRDFCDEVFRDGELKTAGEGIRRVMPPSNPFDPESRAKIDAVVERAKAFCEKRRGLAAGEVEKA